MAKLHELLAVESNLENQANKTLQDLSGTFSNKRHLFEEKRVTFLSNEENSKAVTEEQKDIQTTVGKEIDWISKILAKAIDVSYQIDVANTQANADVVVEDENEPLLRSVPATALLQLEKKVKVIHDLVAAIPTLDPAKGFTEDEQRGKGIFKAREVQKTRTKKTVRPLILYAATKEHPAQVKELSEDLPVGSITEQEWSSLITPSTKSLLLERCDKLLRAVKKARARANEKDLEVQGHKIGRKLLDYVFQPLQA